MLHYTLILNALVGIVASTPAVPKAKSSELQLSSLISAYTIISDQNISHARILSNIMLFMVRKY